MTTLISREKLSKKILGEKLVKILGFGQNWIFGQKFDFLNSVTNEENILGQINLTVAVRPTPTLQTCEGQPRRFSVTSESDSSSDSSFSDPEPQSRNPDFPPSYEEAVL